MGDSHHHRAGHPHPLGKDVVAWNGQTHAERQVVSSPMLRTLLVPRLAPVACLALLVACQRAGDEAKDT